VKTPPKLRLRSAGLAKLNLNPSVSGQPQPTTTLALILGVSACPRAPSLEMLPQCRASAAAFRDHLLTGQALPEANIKDMFDSQMQPSEQIDEIEDWIATRRSASLSVLGSDVRDMIVYYTGHGGFTRSDQAYFLATAQTREGAEGATSIRYSDLAASLKRQTRGLRRYLILDCCFAAAGVIMQSDINSLLVQRVEEELPPEGTAVLCSSSARLVSIAPRGEPYTMFSGALLTCLCAGIPNLRSRISLEELGDQVRNLIQTKFPDRAVRPELHVPDQDKGNPAKIGLFVNAAYRQADEPLPPPPPNFYSSPPQAKIEGGSEALGQREGDVPETSVWSITTPIFTKRILTIVPAPIIAWVNAWKGLFTDSAIFPSDRTGSPDVTAAALSTICVVFLWYALSKSSSRNQLIGALCACFISFSSVLFVFYCRSELKYELPKDLVIWFRDGWYYAYILLIISISIAISLVAAFAFNYSGAAPTSGKDR
jgi:hypothetical protein